MRQPTGPLRLRVVFAALGVIAVVNAGNMEERQNPGFITTLPTAATNTIASITATAISTSRSSSSFTTTDIMTSRPSPFTTTSAPSLQTTLSSAPIPIPLTTSTPAVTISALQGPFFGGVPEKNLDIPLTSVFLILFSLGAIGNAIFYRSKLDPSRRTAKDTISALAGIFCFARVLSCILRNVWAVATTSNGAVFLALVSENAG